MDILQNYLGKVNVLIVDDDCSNVNILTMILKHRGYDVKIALNGELALRSARENLPKLILLKIKMAGMDGYKVCNILKSDKTFSKTTIIFIIGSDEIFEKDKLFTCGGVDYISMPFNNKEILARVETYLKLSYMEQEIIVLENNAKGRAEQLKKITSEIKESNLILEKETTYRMKTEYALKESEKQLKYSLELQKKAEKEGKRLYEIEEYDRIRTEFFSNISHELRTPINVIFSALQVHELKLKDYACRDAGADIYKYTNIMKQNCFRLLRLVNNLIDITKMDLGYFDINRTNNNIICLVEDITLSVADYIENKGLSLIFDTDVEEKIIACDPEKIERVIMNLLSNAIKFTPSGGSIMVNIEDGRENICLRVKDTGRGIPKNKLNAIFERFVQVDKSLARDNEGSGIGLSLVKGLVELHGGKISVKSEVGHGSEFIIYLPCKQVENANDEIAATESVSERFIQKLNIEFSDIYK
ncbi:hybrid sensor histidine kinase/response regulator [Clostridium akagii]|uniref:ATP-binding response regulator n=1 Tax=Clostridium akagii TaxID=91623 RepID=UPI00047E8C80|nr:hybrid sensor histidine kinase/response regulator [Clostridium akagii]